MGKLHNLKQGQEAEIAEPTQLLTATGAITIPSGTIILAHASTPVAVVLPAPRAPYGRTWVIYDGSASGTAAHTATCAAGVTFNVAGNNTATLNAPEECLTIREISATRYCIIANTGSVGLSTV
jgi:hypothetical protein